MFVTYLNFVFLYISLVSVELFLSDSISVRNTASFGKLHHFPFCSWKLGFFVFEYKINVDNSFYVFESQMI